jgi:UDP-N-acetylmuramoylalanine-D-glutamate ligase
MKRELKFKGKKVLIFGLGLLGGGIEAAKWFYKNGAKIFITDKKTKKELLSSIKRLKKIKAKYILGKHRFEDIDSCDIVYFNPGVSYKSEWVKYAKEKGKEVVNDCYLFFKYAKGDIIAITGTRGKTTTTTWIYELLTQVSNIYPNNRPNRLPESSDRIEFTRITRPNNIYPNKRPNNIPEYQSNKDQRFGPNSGNKFGIDSGIDIKFGPNSGKVFGQNSGRNILLGGNQPERSLFKILDKTNENTISVLEISSFQLEFYPTTDERGFKHGLTRIDIETTHEREFNTDKHGYSVYADKRGLQRRSTRIDNNIADQILLEQSVLSLNQSVSIIKAPKIAIITNIYNDHLNRYSSFEEYAGIKAKIFQNQTENDYLILNLDNDWTKFFLRLKPKSQVYFVSLRGLPQTKRKQFGQVKVRGGIYIKDEKVFIEDKDNACLRKSALSLPVSAFRKIYGEHNIYNLLFALLTVYLYLKSKNIKNPQNKIKKLKNFIFNLKTPEFRQEIIYKDKNLMIVNDSAATSPDATINAIERFKKYGDLILITGGTDKNLDFEELAKKIKKEIKPENLILLNGSATKKLIEELRKIKYPLIEENIFEDLREAVYRGLMLILTQINADKNICDHQRDKNPRKSALYLRLSVVLFSPASASFEKFKNEFDRGKKFNKIINGMLKLVYGRNKK